MLVFIHKALVNDFMKRFSFPIIVFLFLLFAVFSSQYWHSFNSFQPEKAFFLESFDSVVSESQKACFAVSFLNNSGTERLAFKAETGSQVLFSESLKVEGEKSREFCFNASELSQGENTVKLSFSDLSLFYQVEKDSSRKPEKTVLDNGSSQDWTLGISLLEDKALQGKAGINWLWFFAGLLLLLFAIAAFHFGLFASFPKFASLALSFALAFCLLILNAWVLGFFSQISFFPIALLLVIEAVIVSFAFRNFFKPSLHFQPEKSAESFNAFDVLLISLIIFLSVFTHLLTPTHLQYFNAFYERSTGLVVESNSIPSLDPLSYFGTRPFAFIPGYFLLEASFSFLTGLQGQALFAFTTAIANLFLLFSVFWAFEALGFKRYRALGFLFFIATTFIFNFLLFSPRHSFSLALMLLAFALLAKYRKWFLPGLFLGIAAFIQVPMLLFFPFLAFFASKEFKAREFAKAWIFGIVIFAILFLPNFLRFGFPTFASPEEWGYLISLPLAYIAFDQGLALLFLALFLIGEFAFFRPKEFFNAFRLKVFAGIILLLAIEAFVSYRFNIVSAFLTALLIVEWIELRKPSVRKLVGIVEVLFLLGFYFIIVLLPQALVPNNVFYASQFLQSHSKASDSILSDPFFGHVLEFSAQRKVLADLWVEYADSGMLDDSWAFLKTRDLKILEKYSIRFVFSQKDRVFDKATSFTELEEPLEFQSLNKVYDDGLIFIHQVPS